MGRSLLLSVLVTGCAAGVAERGAAEPEPPLADHPAIAACRRAADACHPAAWRALRGGGDLSGDWVAAAFLMAGCEGGHAPSCADLGALHEAGRGVALDLDRACELGLSRACARIGRSAPFVAASPTAPLPQPPAPATLPRRRDGEGWRRLAWSLYPEWHEVLGLSREAIARTPPAPPLERALVDLVVSRRMAPVQECVPAAFTWETGAGERGAERSGVVATFTLGTQGQIVEPRARVLPGTERPAEAPGWWRCVEERMAGWRLPLAPSGGRFWLAFAGGGPPLPHAQPGTGELAVAPPSRGGYGVPRPAEAGCVEEHVYLPMSLSGYVTGPLTVQVAITAEGEKRWFRVLTPGVHPDAIEALWKAVRACPFVPARGPDGEPATVWTVFPIRFSRGE